MTLFRLFLATCLVAIVAYTSVTITNHGFNLLPVFFGDMAEMGWPGQFNLDFMCFLALSAIWVAWRHQFSAGGLGLAVLAFFGGMLFLSIYLLLHIQRTGGDIKVLLLGEGRAA
ncbi:hypothetical protein [Novosphingobium sp.]|uniref:hypothetical protein n=1 Tax=Novosphingobium sp. TaxID=1874826 RepID=UPI0022C66BB4|nr:hypothetical protein [Novosphingobium sp.]MCZ8018236.1 hypothetical protein [Novosphingobium sp.]MCZ8033230.1 hypothetical protein [Novosphingobium sp.]MCZ8051685.1 hypothetical protein [Novosphingobium sp.]MCZ8060227.1 hypothetical protein [Novosphingobium sp.]MCZ8231869.1 hypothetical protein [Novosphingobium sp.]